jgi:hypothetical protein
MQNKPNLGNDIMSANLNMTSNYELLSALRGQKNKPNSNPIQSQFNPKQTQFKPISKPNKPNFTTLKDANSCLAHPVVCGQRLYIRCDQYLYAYDIRGN